MKQLHAIILMLILLPSFTQSAYKPITFNRPISIPEIIQGSATLSLSYLIITQAPEAYQKLQTRFRKKEPAPEPIKLTDEEKKICAYHESGHALVCILMPETHDHLKKITIVPGEVNDCGSVSLGYTESESKDKKYTYSKKDMTAIVMKALGGTIAEEIIFNTITTGASDDLLRASSMVAYMVCECGMSETLGKMSYHYNYSQKTAEVIDTEIRKVMDECYAKTKQLLIENKDKLELLATTLLEKETLTGEEVYKLFDMEVTPSPEASKH